jgi:anti-sigma factor RsiW
MSCPSAVTHSMYADGALLPREAALLWRHAAHCTACRTRIEALRQESEVLRAALKHVDEAAPIPRFAPPARARDFVVLVTAVLAIGGFSQAFWNTLAAALPSELTWLSPFKSGVLFERAVSVVTFIISEGSAMWTAALNFVGASLVLAFVAWLAVSAVRHRASAGVAAALLAVVAALPSIGHAFEIRRSDGAVTIAADEIVNDTVLAMGQTVSIDGTINGDLLAFGQEVTVRGNVTGNLVTGAQRVIVEGTIGGSVLGGAETLALTNARIGRDLYGFANQLDIAPSTNVSGNAIAGAETVNVDGRVGIDLKGFGSTVNVGGAVEGDVEAGARTITLLSTARVGGNVTAHVDSIGDFSVADGATVGGTVDEQLVERERRRNHYLTFGYYGRQVVRLGGAFLVGLLLLWAVPVLRDVSLPRAGDVLRSGGIGLAAAVTLPVAALLVCLTIVGLPLGMLAFLLGFIGLYLAKIVIAQIIGRAVFRAPENPPHYAATLATGLIIVIVAINLPLIGGLANFVLTLVGFGVIVTLLMARFDRESVA